MSWEFPGRLTGSFILRSAIRGESTWRAALGTMESCSTTLEGSHHETLDQTHSDWPARGHHRSRLHDSLRLPRRGEFEVPVTVRRPDELGDLAGPVNTMARDIHKMLEGQRARLLAISHELRSPLTRARLNAEVLQARADGAEVRL
mgnify:CR=1 FL=1